MKDIIYTNEYTQGRRVLRLGVRFRVEGGPYYKTIDGEIIDIAVEKRVTFRFVRLATAGRRIWIEASDAKGGFWRLPITRGSRNPKVPEIVHRPFRVVKVHRAAARRKGKSKHATA